MRKVALGFLLLALLAWSAGPAVAGSADPLGLITSGAVLPYFGSTGAGAALAPGSVSYLELAMPLSGADLHMFFHDTTCKKGPVSVGLPMTGNDSDYLKIDGLEITNPVDGLITLAKVDQTGFILQPLNPAQVVHARVLWSNLTDGFLRTLEPISVMNFENFSFVPSDANVVKPFDGANFSNLYNPLKDGATFITPAAHFGVETKLYLICPNEIIVGFKASKGCSCTPEQISNGTCGCSSDELATQANTPSLAFEEGFPEIILTRNDQKTALRLRVYDHDERFKRDVRSDCSCLTRRTMAEFSSVYANPTEIPLWAYTEMEATARTREYSSGPAWFTGYRVIHWVGLDNIGRLSNSSADFLQEFPFAP